MKSTILYIFTFLLFFSFFFLIGGYVYYSHKYPQPYKTKYLKRHYSNDIILKVGGRLEAPDGRFQYFLNFSSKKNRNTTRIGAFGNSYTYGADVDESFTYPHLLQKMFDESLNQNVEILNFGAPGHSFQEQFFLWKKYAKQYEIDYILLGSKEFFPDRDVTFRRNWDFDHFFYPRDRFILSDRNKVKIVSINKSTLRKRYKKYYSLIPSHKSLLYDRRPFQIYELFFPFLRYNIENPFYYKKMSIEEESAKINIILLEKIKKIYDKKIFVLIDDFVFIDSPEMNRKYYESIEKLYNFNYLNFSLEDKSLYRSYYHYSSLGYEIIAKYFFYALMGKQKFSVKFVDCYFKDEASGKKNKINLHEVNSIIITSNKKPFLQINLGIDDQIKKSSINKNAKSFIGFSSKRSNDFGNLIYYSLPIELKENMKLYIQTSNKIKVELGKVTPLDHYAKIFTFYSHNIENIFDRTIERFNPFLKLNNHLFFRESKDLSLLVENNVIGKLLYSRRHKSWKILLNNIIQMLKINGPQATLEKDLPDRFSLFIEYNMKNKKKFRSEFFNWKCQKKRKQATLNLFNFKPLK